MTTNLKTSDRMHYSTKVVTNCWKQTVLPPTTDFQQTVMATKTRTPTTTTENRCSLKERLPRTTEIRSQKIPTTRNSMMTN